MKTTTISTSELYESVWQHPLKYLADKWQVHPHTLGQLLDKHAIPRPGNGYWTQKSMGKPVVVTPFPKSLSTNILIDISCLQFAKDQKSKSVKAELPIPTKSLGRYPLLKGIKGSLRKPSFQWDFLLIQDFNDTNVLRVDVSQDQKDRAINILHRLLAAMDKNNWPVLVEKSRYERRLTNVVVVDGEKISFRLREKLKQVKRELTEKDFEEKKKWGRVWHEKINIPSGELHLTLDGPLPSGLSQVIKDNKNLPLEDQLGHFIDNLIVSAECSKVLRKEREKEQEIYKRKQAVWDQYESLVTAQTQNIKTFFSLFEKSQRAGQCRALIDAITASETFKQNSELEQKRWLMWANSIVDIIDPVTTFEMPELMDEQNCLTKAVFARSIKEAGLAVKLSVPSLSLEDVSHGLETLAMQGKTNNGMQ
jgi:hypothetical protein